VVVLGGNININLFLIKQPWN